MPKGGNGGNGGGGDGGTDTGTIKGNRKDNLLTGTEAAELIQGNGGNDTLLGMGGDDTLDGGTGNDRLDGGAGSDSINGGDGADTVVFSGVRTDYVVTQIDATTVEVTGPDGTDTVTNVENFEFADGTMTFAEVLIPPTPNLTATGLSADDVSLAPGEVAMLSWTIGSDGDADADPSQTRVLIATAPDAGSVVGTTGAQAVGTLATGSATSAGMTLDMSGYAPGTYWVAAQADSSDALAESDEGDNISNWVQIEVEAPVANLSATNLVIGDVSVAPGEETALSFTINSDGTGNAGETWASVLVSTTPDEGGVIDVPDIQIIDPLATGTSSNVQTSVSLHGLDPGVYWVAVQADSQNVEAESDEGDNISNWVQIEVEVPVVNVAVTSYIGTGSELDLTDGATLNLFHEIENTGNVSGSFTVYSNLTVDGTPDTVIYGLELYSGYVTAGETATAFVENWLPDGFDWGDYQVLTYVVFDSDVEGYSEPYPDPDNETLLPVNLTKSVVYGTTGDDVYVGADYDQTFYLDDGDDLVIASDGLDVIDGYLGFDTVDYSGHSSAISAGSAWDNPTATEVWDNVLPGVSQDFKDTLTDVEKIIGTAFDDFFNFFDTNPIAVIESGAGNDLIATELQTQNITFDLGSGDDWVVGGFGDDTYTGGTGADVFNFATDDTRYGTDGSRGDDVITDFDAAEDTLNFRYGYASPVYDPLADAIQLAEGVLFGYGADSSVLVEGALLADFDATNVTVEAEDPPWGTF